MGTRKRGKSPDAAPGGGNRSPQAGAAEEPKSVLVPLLRTLAHLLPELRSWFWSVQESRNPDRIIYPIAVHLWTMMFLFWSKLQARRQIRLQFNTPQAVGALNRLAGTRIQRMMSPDTLPYGLARIAAGELAALQHALVNRLIRSKVLESERLLGQYYMIAIDMTGMVTFGERHCAHCLHAQPKEGAKYYYHAVLEAKLVTRNGLAISVASEFVENLGGEESRQDCELKAFYRMAPKLKKLFPQLRICVLLDGLYAVGPVLDICKDYKWGYIITFKEGRAPAVFEDYEQLRDAQNEQGKGIQKEANRTFRWVNAVAYGQRKVNVLECEEEEEGKKRRRFVWLLNVAEIGENNYQELADEGGRQRWRIENEGFNMQKTGGYGLEHAYSEDEELMKRFYLLLQIAHGIWQLLEKGLFKGVAREVFGSLRNMARRFLEEVRTVRLQESEFKRLLEERIQIRFGDTS